jgi:type VI secretion system protein ImpM
MLALYGKHPAKGDFIESGLGALKPAVEGWLDTVLADARQSLAEAWEPTWATATPLRFWIGETIWGEAVAGVLIPSADAVGRRFPLLILGTGADCPTAPILNPNQDWHDAVAARLHETQAAPAIAPGVLDGIAPPEHSQTTGPIDFWAATPGQDMAALLADIALTDHSRAAMGRSYWWTADRFSQVWAGQGLPSGHVLAWFLRGYQQNG